MISKNISKSNFQIIDGPPYLSGIIHLGTAYNKILKDTYAGLLSIKPIRAGFDANGLPIENKVKQLHNINSLTSFSSTQKKWFKNKCLEFSNKNLDKMILDFKELVSNFDFQNYYITSSKKYIHFAQKIFKKLNDQGNIFLNQRVLPFCPSCEVFLSKHELVPKSTIEKQFYFTVYSEPYYFLVWTTTPWTLPNNLAIFFNPTLDYIVCDFQSKKIIFLESFLESFTLIFGKPTNYKPFRPFKLNYSFLFASGLLLESSIVQPKQTGFVHIDPFHGEEDYQEVTKYGLEYDHLKTSFELLKFYNSKSIFSLSQKIIELMEPYFCSKVVKETIERDSCWRCSSLVYQEITPQLFLNIKKNHSLITKISHQINWINNFGKNRFIHWIENLSDWNISRNRYWGIPIPKSLSKKDYVFDVWYDSAVVPLFLGHQFDLAIESHDQTRGWFSVCTILASIFWKKPPYKNIIIHGVGS